MPIGPCAVRILICLRREGRERKDGSFKGKTLQNGGNNALKRESEVRQRRSRRFAPPTLIACDRMWRRRGVKGVQVESWIFFAECAMLCVFQTTIIFVINTCRPPRKKKRLVRRSSRRRPIQTICQHSINFCRRRIPQQRIANPK